MSHLEKIRELINHKKYDTVISILPENILCLSGYCPDSGFSVVVCPANHDPFLIAAKKTSSSGKINLCTYRPFQTTIPMYTPAVKEALFKRVPLKAIAEPKDMAYGALLLTSDESWYMTRLNLTIDGGYTMDGACRMQPIRRNKFKYGGGSKVRFQLTAQAYESLREAMNNPTSKRRKGGIDLRTKSGGSEGSAGKSGSECLPFVGP